MYSLRWRLTLFILATTFPLLLYFSYLNYSNYYNKRNLAFTQLDTIATITATEHKQIQEGARQLLVALSTLPLSNNSYCSNFLSTLKSSYIRYQNFGVVDQSGRIICAADLPNAVNNPPSQSLIDQTLSLQQFSLGSYYPVENNSAVINFAYPFSKSQIIYASLSLDWVTSFVQNLHLTQDPIVTNILDRNGTVLSRVPINSDAVGQNFVSDPLVQEILVKGRGQTTKMGIDQVKRLYSFTALDETKSTFIAVGMSEDDLFQSVKKSIRENLLIFILIFASAVIISRKTGDELILKQMEALQKLDKLKDEFVSLASHQLRSPMTAIRWLAESVLDSQHKLSQSSRRSIQKIHTTTLHLITLTSTLLNISRLESGTLTPHIKPIILNSLFSKLIKDSTINRLHNRLKITLNLKIKTIHSDPLLLTEIVSILLDNAIKYSTKGTTIALSTHHINSHFILKLSNLGIGIPSTQTSQIFTRFYRADNARAHIQNGNGLGLYLARLIARKLEGDLTFKSVPNGLTTFTLTLPISYH